MSAARGGATRGPIDRAVRVALVLLAAATLVHAGPASADGATPGLGGYQGIAAASGLHILYNPDGLLPTAAPVDVGAPDAYATIASGPATFARASVVDPGDLLANPDALFSLGVSGWKSGTIPAYPYRVAASSGSATPKAESAPGPGLDARVSADTSGSVATAEMPAATTPALATFGSMTSTATTAVDPTTVTVHARTEITALNVLGVLTIDSILTDITSSSNGTTTTVTGGTTIGGAEVLGTPVSIDEQGVHPASGTADAPPTTSLLGGLVGSALTPLVGNLDDVLAAAGIRITVAGAAPVTGGTSGQIAADGLRIDLQLSDKTVPGLTALLNAVPYVAPIAPGAPSLSDVVKIARTHNIVALQIGRSLVSLTARPSRSSAPAARPSTPATPTAVLGASAPATAARPSIAAAPSLASAGAVPTATNAVAEAQPEVPIGAGVGALALLALVLQPFIGDRLARASQSLLAADPVTTCPMEER